MAGKYEGIDERIIKCSCDLDNCREAGISFSDNFLRFQFLEYDKVYKTLDQRTVSMMLDKENVEQLIKELQTFKFYKNGKRVKKSKSS